MSNRHWTLLWTMHHHTYSPQQLQGSIINPILQMRRASEKVLGNVAKVSKPKWELRCEKLPYLWLLCPARWAALRSGFSMKSHSFQRTAMPYSSPTPQRLAQGPGAQWALSKCWRRGRLHIGYWPPVSYVLYFNALGGNKQSRHGCEGRSSDRGHSHCVQLLPAGLGGQIKSDSGTGKPFPGQLSCCSNTGLALPFWPLLIHCPSSSLSWPSFTEPWPQTQPLWWASDDNDHPTVGSLECSLESYCPNLRPSLWLCIMSWGWETQLKV